MKEIEISILQNSFYKNSIKAEIPTKIFNKFNYFKKTDINDDAISTFWRLFSNYAHSEYISIIHYMAIWGDIEKKKQILDFCYEFLIFINLKLKKNIQFLFIEDKLFQIDIWIERDFINFERDFLISVNKL